jgi:hypothetical protein
MIALMTLSLFQGGTKYAGIAHKRKRWVSGKYAGIAQLVRAADL